MPIDPVAQSEAEKDALWGTMVRTVLYDMAIKHLNNLVAEDAPEQEESLAEEDLEAEEDDEFEEDYEVEEELDAEKLAVFVEWAGKWPSYDPEAVRQPMEALQAVADRPLAETEPMLKEGLVAAFKCVADLKRRYARLWAAARLARIRRTEADPKELDDGEAGSQKEEAADVDDFLARLNPRTTNVARADEVTIRVARKDNPFRGLLMCGGVETFDSVVTEIEPFSRKLVKQPAYLASVVTAVNAAMQPYRPPPTQTREEIEADFKQKSEENNRFYPEYWGPDGVGSMLCLIDTIRNHVATERLKEAGRDEELEDVFIDDGCHPLESYKVAYPALVELSDLLDKKLSSEGGDPHEDLESVRPVRQFFACKIPYIAGEDGTLPEELSAIIALVHDKIAFELRLDKERRSHYLHLNGQDYTRKLRLLSRSQETTVEHSLGKVVISRDLELRRIEPSSKLTSKKKLVTLVNEAFEKVSNQRAVLSMPHLI